MQEQEAPSVFSVVNRHVVGRVDLASPAEDGSRTLRLYAASGETVIESALSPELCAFIAAKLAES
jgi:hypothetical protein